MSMIASPVDSSTEKKEQNVLNEEKKVESVTEMINRMNEGLTPMENDPGWGMNKEYIHF